MPASNDDSPDVRIEFLGILRARTGREHIDVQATTTGEAIDAAASMIPDLTKYCILDGWLAPGYLISVNGERFTTDPSLRLQSGDRILLLSADAGG